MDNTPDSIPAWSEENSRRFIELGRVFTPAREEIRDILLDLIPATSDETFQVVELGVGEGWLSEAILERFPSSRVFGLDGSDTMLRQTAERLRRFAGRFELRTFRLEDSDWRTEFAGDVRCFAGSLVVHHLDGAGKRTLYRDLFGPLAVGGALLLADVVAPAGERERRLFAQGYDAMVRRQALDMTGSLDAYKEFLATKWNLFKYPDPMDMPSTVAEHMTWLTEAGFSNVSVFRLQAGHAIYGGYKSAGALEFSPGAEPG
jgi:tRNA (cmo5U34)-methyltransferase